MRLLVGRDGEAAQRLAERLGIGGAHVHQHIAEAAAGAEADDRRRRDRDDVAGAHGAEFLGEAGNDRRSRVLPAGAFGEGLQRHHEETGIGLGVIVDEVEADDRGIVRDRTFRLQDAFDLCGERRCPGDRGAVGQLRDDEEGALVVLRQEAGRRDPPHGVDAGAEGCGHSEADEGDAHETRHALAIAVARPVDAAHDIADRAAPWPVMRPEQNGAERRRQGQRVDRREHHRDRDSDGELPEELAGNAGDEGDRHEDREQHQRDRDDRGDDLAHGALGRFRRRQLGMLLHHALDVLDHDDRVVDDDADGEHHRQQRDGIGGIADGVEHDEGADQAHRHGDGRDQRRPEIAEEQVDDEDDEDEGFDQRLLDLVDRGGDEGGRIVGHLPGEAFGEGLLEVADRLLDGLERGEGIGAGRLVDADQNGRAAVQAGVAVEIGGAELEPRHVREPQHRAVGIGAQHDLAEFLGRGQAALGLDVEL